MGVQDVSVSATEAYHKCEKDINFFGGLCLPHVVRFHFPRYYVVIWMLLVAALKRDAPDTVIEKILRFAIGLPRGFAKTTFLKVLIAWLICFDKIRFILIICATEPLAESFLSDLHNILQSDNIQAVFGRWDPATDQVDSKRGVYHRRILIMKARSAGSAVRGIVEDNIRPDFILCDDMQTKENDDSDTERERLLNWFVGTLLKTVDQNFSMAVYVGNMYSDHCILYQLKKNPFWTSLITGAILENGEPLWPEVFTLEDLYNSYLHDESLGKADIWFAEVMNDPIESQVSLLTGPIPVYASEIVPSPDASFVTVDPAGFRKASDDNVVCAHYVCDTRYLVAEMDGGLWTPGKTAERSIELAITHDSTCIFIEGYGYQQSLGYWTARLMQEHHISGIAVQSITRVQSKTKIQHIRGFIAELGTKDYMFIRATDRAKFIWQAQQYKLNKKNNKDDWLDCPAMGIEVRNQYPQLLGTRGAQVKRISSSSGVRSNNTPF